MSKRPSSEEPMPGRRAFLRGGTALTALALLPSTAPAAAPVPPPPPGEPEDLLLEGAEYVDISLRVNSQAVTRKVDTRTTLLDLLREDLDLNGTRKGCNHGACGACTVHIDGKNANACLQLAVLCAGKEITTIEGLADGEELHPMQTAFIEHDGFQCGYCTSGQIMSAVAVVNDGHAKSRTEIRELMSGNLCRCGAYNGIVDAVEDVINQAK